MKYPYIEARNHGDEQDTGHLTRIVMHSTVTPCTAGKAREVAGWFHTWDKEASAHYVVDNTEIIKCLHDNVIAWHAPPNTNSLGVELCDPSDGPADRWDGANHKAMLKLAAGLVADKCAAYGIPIRHIGPAELRAGEKGLCGHIDVTNAWHETTHTDPADYPWDQFLEMVQDAAGAQPKPKPAKVVIDRYLRNRHPMMHGADVRAVQKKTGAHVDGYFGPKTDDKVRAFQRSKKLTIDGVVGPATTKALGFTWKG